MTFFARGRFSWGIWDAVIDTSAAMSLLITAFFSYGSFSVDLEWKGSSGDSTVCSSNQVLWVVVMAPHTAHRRDRNG